MRYKPESISSIATKVQNVLIRTLDQLLNDNYRQYIPSDQQYRLTTPDVFYGRVESDLKMNITKMMNLEIWKNYGAQTIRNGYMYSTGPRGEVSTNYNYAVSELETLKSQVERNLVRKLAYDFDTYKTR